MPLEARSQERPRSDRQADWYRQRSPDPWSCSPPACLWERRCRSLRGRRAPGRAACHVSVNRTDSACDRTWQTRGGRLPRQCVKAAQPFQRRPCKRDSREQGNREQHEQAQAFHVRSRLLNPVAQIEHVSGASLQYSASRMHPSGIKTSWRGASRRRRSTSTGPRRYGAVGFGQHHRRFDLPRRDRPVPLLRRLSPSRIPPMHGGRPSVCPGASVSCADRCAGRQSRR